MFRIDTPNSVASPPTPDALGTEGYWKEAEVGVGNGTKISADWMNALQETLIHPIDAKSIAHKKSGTFDCLTQAIQAYIAADVPVASTTVQGRVELATPTEVQTGTDNTRAATPAGLVTATDALRGLVKTATDAEALAGAATDKVIKASHLGLNHYIGAGVQKYAEIIGSEIVLVTASYSVQNPDVIRTLPYTFADTSFACFANCDVGGYGAVWLGVEPYSTSQVIFELPNSNPQSVFVLCIGKAA